MVDLKPVQDLLVRLRDRAPFRLRPDQVWDVELGREVEALEPGALGLTRADRLDSLKAGLHLWNDDLGRGHELAQELHDATGSCWHGLMHRREGDPDNARYWFRRVGEHPAFEILLSRARLLAEEHPGHPFARHLSRASHWDPLEWVNACAAGEDPFLQAVQRVELDVLATHCLESLS